MWDEGYFSQTGGEWWQQYVHFELLANHMKLYRILLPFISYILLLRLYQSLSPSMFLQLPWWWTWVGMPTKDMLLVWDMPRLVSQCPFSRAANSRPVKLRKYSLGIWAAGLDPLVEEHICSRWLYDVLRYRKNMLIIKIVPTPLTFMLQKKLSINKIIKFASLMFKTKVDFFLDAMRSGKFSHKTAENQI